LKPVLTVSLLVVLAACGAPPRELAATNSMNVGTAVTAQNIPISQQFRTLDDYLAHLELIQAPVDGPWYRQIRPGVYELQTGNLRVLGSAGEMKRIFTREELEREFGFRR
jgi:hypothetical protein